MPVNDPRLSYGLDFNTNSNVISNATWTSVWMDSQAQGLVTTWANFITQAVIPGSASITYYFRSANLANYSDATAFTTSISSLVGNYLQVNAVFTKDNSSLYAPILNAINPNAVSLGQAYMSEEYSTNVLPQRVATVTPAAAGTTGTFARTSIANDPYSGVSVASGTARFTQTPNNLFKESENIPGSNWALINTFLQSNYSDPAKRVTKLIPYNGLVSTYIYQGVSGISGIYTLSVDAKPAGLNYMILEIGTSSCYFNLTNGSMTSLSANGTATATYIGNGYYRCTLTMTVAALPVQAVIHASNVGSGSVTGDAVNGIYIARPQVELGSVATAYNPTGTGLGQGLMVEQGTSNLLTLNQSSAETDLTGFANSSNNLAAGSTLTRVATAPFVGSWCVQVNAVSQYMGVALSIGLVANTTYMMSAWVNCPVGKTLALYPLDATNGINGTLVNFVGTGTWQRVSSIITTGATANPSCFLQIRAQDAAPNVTFFVDALQVEAGSYSTSWTLGGTTRAAETFTIPGANVNPAQGAIIGRFYVDGDMGNAITSGTHMLFDIGAGSGGSRFYFGGSGGTPGVYTLLVYNDAGALQINVNWAQRLAVGYHTFAIRYGAGTASFYIDGVQRGTGSGTMPTALASALYVGTYIAGGANWGQSNQFVATFKLDPGDVACLRYTNPNTPNLIAQLSNAADYFVDFSKGDATASTVLGIGPYHSTGSEKLSLDTRSPWSGTNALKVDCSTSDLVSGIRTRALTTNGTAAAFSVWLKGTGDVNLRTDGNLASVIGPIISLTPYWKNYYIQGTVSSAGSAGNIYASVVTNNTNSNPAKTFWVGGLQIEDQHNYATSFIQGGSRNAESLTVPVAAINPASFSVIIKANFTGDKTNANCYAGGYNLFGQYNGANNYLELIRVSNVLQLATSSNVGTYSAISYVCGALIGWHTIGIRLSATEMAIYIDGTKVGTTANPNIPTTYTQPGIGFLGVNGGYQWNDLIDNCQIFSTWLSDTEMAAKTSNSYNFVTEHRTTYHLRMDNSFVHAEGGARITNNIDMSLIGSLDGSNITWTATTNAATLPITVNTSQSSGVTATGGNNISRTGGPGGSWDSSVLSNEFIPLGQNGYVQFTTAENTTNKMCGLISQNKYVSNSAYSDINYAVYMNGAVLNFYENGFQVSPTLTIAANDVYKVQVVNNIVTYWSVSGSNGVNALLYTSANPVLNPLFIKATLIQIGATVNSITLGRLSRADIDVSVDGGVTFNAATSAATIPLLTAGTSVAGSGFIIREKLVSPAAATTNASITSLRALVNQKWVNNKNTKYRPVFGTMRFVSSGISKYQLEQKAYPTSYIDYNTTRLAETITIPTTVANAPIIYAASGSIIVRAYVDGDVVSSPSVAAHNLFDLITSSGFGRISLYSIAGSPTTYSTYYQQSNGTNVFAQFAQQLSIGWHTFGVRWNSTSLTIYLDGVKQATSIITLPITAPLNPLTIGHDYAGNSQWDNSIAEVNLFRQDLLDSEMSLYTAASGAVINVDTKHSYQLKFENNLNYGCSAIFFSRWLDAGASATGTPWITLDKVDSFSLPTTQTKYLFKANDTKDDTQPWLTDITLCKGRYMKVQCVLISQDATSVTPSISYLEPVPSGG